MADDETEEVEVEQQKSKHDRTAANQLEKVTDYAGGEKEDMKVTSTALGNLMNNDGKKVATLNVKKEDVEWMVRELELPRLRVERKLVEHDGDVKAAVRDLIGFS